MKITTMTALLLVLSMVTLTSVMTLAWSQTEDKVAPPKNNNLLPIVLSNRVPILSIPEKKDQPLKTDRKDPPENSANSVDTTFGPALPGDWPQWRGPDRTGISKDTGLLGSWPPAGPELLWTFREAGDGYSSMSVVGDRLYSMGTIDKKEYVYAIDLKTQKKLWSVEVGPVQLDNFYVKGPCGTPTIDGGLLYVIGNLGNLVCVETASGRKVWSQELFKNLAGRMPGYGYSESPLVDGDQVVATPGGKEGAIAAFEKKTGTLKWRSTAFPVYKAANGNDVYASIIAIKVGGIRQYVQMTWDTVASVRASDGKLLWKIPFRFGISTPIYKNGYVFVSSQLDCKLIKLMPKADECKAEEIYADKEMCNHHGGVILVGEYLYGYSRGGWTCQDFKTGKTIWNKIPGRDMGKGSVTFADGNLYAYHENGEVLLLKATPDGYKEQGRFRIPERNKSYSIFLWSYPVVANGKLYLRDHDLIFCYDINKPK